MIEEQVYVIYPDGTKLARVGYEAIRDGYCESYFYDGLFHRDDDDPAYKDVSGCQKWYLHGVLHRLTGPAEIYQVNGAVSENYFFKGKEINDSLRELFIKIINSPLQDVILYINHENLGEVAKERLKSGK